VTVVVMGPAGAGKTTVGRALAAALDWPFLDADDLHSPENVARMAGGTPLTDADRAPWLARVHDAVAHLASHGGHAVVACSALRQAYRDQIARGIADVRWVYLSASPDLLARRLAEREGHFAGPAILPGQLADLEPPREAIVVPAALPVAEAVACIRTAIGS
jgi:gluconokinase